MTDSLYLLANSSQDGNALALFFIFVLIFWSLIWKGIALWKSARLSQKKWFVVLLVLNTAGILEIIYVFWVAWKKESELKPGWWKAISVISIIISLILVFLLMTAFANF